MLKIKAGEGELLAFEKSLATHAVEIYKMRSNSLPAVSKSMEKSFCSLTDEKEQAKLRYVPDLSIESSEEYLEKLVENRSRDILTGSTRKGPHRDDFLFLLRERDARIFASEGQQRGLILALRLAEFSYLRVLGRTPIILADDVLVELDSFRKANFESCCLLMLRFCVGTAILAK